ncbi:liprin-alpha-1-like [Bos indicus x Bos taurus]|uniref:liprin-alpha-1-like n=1 Tax=Bos indicus x Bos taurus TaxID=30522 RepID=UPI000F7D2B4A|nr:liprin-alpha-1-like [Bos indicus x Bos taurus]
MGRRRARLWALFQCCNPKAKAKTRKTLASAQVLEAEWTDVRAAGGWARRIGPYPELASPTEELSACREQLLAREKEIAEMRAERNNTRLLLEHLECLVSQYVPSLRMTMGKQQARSPAGMKSEVEVLKALKSLFEHHKALDEKLMILKEKKNPEKILMDGVLDINPKQENMPSANGKRTCDGSLARVIQLQEIINNQLRDQSQMKELLAALSAQVTDLEEDLDMARKDLLKSEEFNVKLQRDVREAMAQKEDVEKRITTLEKRYLTAQREASSVHDLDDKPEKEIANKDSLHRQEEDENRPLQEHLELEEQKLQQTLLRAETLPEVEAELAQLVAALSKVEERHRNIKERLRQMEAQLEEKNKELLWVQPLKDQDREHGRQASVLANVAQAFESDEGTSDGEGDGVTLFSSAALLSPSGQADAETLAVMIQEQLDKINEEIRLIQEKKENTEQRAEGIENRVGTGSSSNLRRFKSLNSLNLNATSSHASSCPPSRGRSKPRRRRHSPARKVDKLGIMTLLPPLPEEVQDDKTAIKCEASTPALLRFLRLDRLDRGSPHRASYEDIRDAHNSTGSQDGPGGNPSSSSSSSQDLLQKAPKKKGIKSSIGRLFGKKEKGRPGHPGKEVLGPVAGKIFTARTTWKAPVNADN